MLPKKYALYFLLLLFLIFSLTAILFIRSNLNHKQRQKLQSSSLSGGDDGSTSRTTIIDGEGGYVKKEEHLHRQQERDDLLLQRERDKLEKERLAMNKEPVVVTKSGTVVKQNAAGGSASSSAKRLLSIYYDQLIVEDNDTNSEDDDNSAAEKLEEKEERTSASKMCKSTLSGHELVTDSRGYTCSVSELNSRTMCCPNEKAVQDEEEKSSDEENSSSSTVPVKQFSCDTCHSKHQCCEVYEYCVACCLKPENRSQLQKLYSKYLSEKKLVYTRINTVFQFCAARCRTNSNSVMNENKYLTNAKHCFGSKDPVDIFAAD